MSNYRVMLVDDNVVIRKGLATNINWQSMDCELCAEASHGDEAYSLLDSAKPDIIISDLDMPVCNGIHLARKIHHSKKRIKLILMSEHMDVTMLSLLQDYHVVTIIAKPTSQEAIGKAIHLATQSLKGDRYITKLEQTIERLSAKYTLQKRHELLYAAINGHSAQSLDVSLPCYIADICTQASPSRPLSPKHRTALRQYLSKNLNRYPSHLFYGKGHHLLIMLSCNHEEQVRQAITELRDYASTELSLDLAIGVSPICHQMHRLPQSMEHAHIACNHAYQYNLQDIILYGSMWYGTEDAMRQLLDLATKHRKLVQQLDLHLAKTLTKDMVRLAEESHVPMPFLWRILDGLLSIQQSLLKDTSDQELVTLVSTKGAAPMDLAAFQSDMNEAANSIIRMSRARKESSLGTVLHIQRYIDSNYKGKLTVTELADIANVSSHYLSQIFQRYTHMGVREYVEHVRVENAKSLLSNSILPIHHIASECGIPDPRYFARVFKKATGLSPLAYRKSHS